MIKVPGALRQGHKSKHCDSPFEFVNLIFKDYILTSYVSIRDHMHNKQYDY